MEGTIQSYGDNFLPVVPTNIPLHTAEHPFCGLDPACPCYEDPDNIQALSQAIQSGILTPEERTASRYYAGTRAGMHPEDDPYITYGKPPGRTYITTRSGLPAGYDDEGYDDTERRSPTTALRWRDTQGNQVIQHGNRRIVIHDEPPPRRKPRLHWSLFLGIAMTAVVLLFAGLSDLSAWWANHQLDAIVYPGDSAGHPSHYIFLNLNGTVMIIELPHGDETHARIYKGPTLFSDDAALIPVTGDFRKVNGKEEMRVHIQDQTIIYVNDGTQFRPQG